MCMFCINHVFYSVSFCTIFIQVMLDTLVEFLASAELGYHLSPSGGAAWKKLFDMLVVVVEQEQKKIAKDQAQCSFSSCSIN